MVAVIHDVSRHVIVLLAWALTSYRRDVWTASGHVSVDYFRFVSSGDVRRLAAAAVPPLWAEAAFLISAIRRYRRWPLGCETDSTKTSHPLGWADCEIGH